MNPANKKNIEYNKNTQVEVLVCLALHIEIFNSDSKFQNSGSQKSSSSFTNSGCLFNQHLQNVFAKCWKGDTRWFCDKFYSSLVDRTSMVYSIQSIIYFSKWLKIISQQFFFLFVAIFYKNSVSSLVISVVYFSWHLKLRSKVWKETLQTLNTWHNLYFHRSYVFVKNHWNRFFWIFNWLLNFSLASRSFS